MYSILQITDRDKKLTCFYGLEMRNSAAHLISALIISGISVFFSIVWHGVYDSRNVIPRTGRDGVPLGIADI